MSRAAGLAGTGQLLRLALRRDRVLAPVWVLGIGIAPVAYVSAVRAAYPTAASRQEFAAVTGRTAALVVRNGPLTGSSVGELVSWQSGFIPVAVGVCACLMVIRHTRAEEESGRRELLGATAIGRHAGLAAALIAGTGASVLMALLDALLLTGQGLPAAGSVALGLEFALVGTVFAAVGGLTAQVITAATAARSLAIGVLALAFALRGIGDADAVRDDPSGLSWLVWLSPVGWAHQLRPFGGERWWPLALAAAATALLVTGSVALSARRDLGGGLLPERSGPATGSPRLRGPLALAWRLHRGTLAVWTAVLLPIGLLMGSVGGSIDTAAGDDPRLRDLFLRLGGGRVLLDSYFAGTMSLYGLIAAACAVQVTLRARAEEAAGRAEPVLATAVGRLRWAGSHLVLAVLGPAAVLATCGLATGVGHGLSSGGVGTQAGRLLLAALVQLPAVWVLTAVAVAGFGLAPRAPFLGWLALAGAGLISLVGSALRLSPWLLDVSPFAHVPRLPGGVFSITPLLALSAVAVVVGATGLAALRRRDVPAS